jgi:hypothetical protein
MSKLTIKFEHKVQSKFHPRTAHDGPEGRKVIIVLFVTSALDWSDNATSPSLYHRERDPVPTVQEAG